MSNSEQKNTEAQTGRVQIGNLQQQEKQLNEKEAESVKGGGGLHGGVVLIHAGEEIPQKNRR
jgi:hypothetical protein